MNRLFERDGLDGRVTTESNAPWSGRCRRSGVGGRGEARACCPPEQLTRAEDPTPGWHLTAINDIAGTTYQVHYYESTQ